MILFLIQAFCVAMALLCFVGVLFSFFMEPNRVLSRLSLAIIYTLLWLAFLGIGYKAHAADRHADVRTGILGTFVADMNEIAAGAKAAGFRVTRSTWLSPIVKADVCFAHSAGAYGALLAGCRRIVTIDPPMFPPMCPAGSVCTNFYAPEDMLPFILCCGGFRVTGALNVRVAPGHTSLPRRIARRVVSEGFR